MSGIHRPGRPGLKHQGNPGRSRYPALIGGLLVITLCLASTANATVIELSPYDSGELTYDRRSLVTPPDFPPPPYPVTERYRNDEPLQQMDASRYSSAGCLCTHLLQVNGYAIYDLSGVGDVIGSASLKLDLYAFGEVNVLEVTTIDSISALDLSLLPVGTLPADRGETLVRDIADDTVVGSTNLDRSQRAYEIPLSMLALELINDTSGLLALGLSYPDPPEESISEARFLRPPRLALTPAIPVPSSLSLALAACALLLTGRVRVAG